jgi:hypothetical protein
MSVSGAIIISSTNMPTSSTSNHRAVLNERSPQAMWRVAGWATAPAKHDIGIVRRRVGEDREGPSQVR